MKQIPLLTPTVMVASHSLWQTVYTILMLALPRVKTGTMTPADRLPRTSRRNRNGPTGNLMGRQHRPRLLALLIRASLLHQPHQRVLQPGQAQHEPQALLATE